MSALMAAATCHNINEDREQEHMRMCPVLFYQVEEQTLKLLYSAIIFEFGVLR